MSNTPHTVLSRLTIGALIWGGYSALMIYMGATFDVLSSGMLFIYGLIGLGLWLSSEVLRFLCLRHDWFARGAWGLSWRVALSVALLSATLQLMIYVLVHLGQGLGFLHFPGGKAQYSLGLMVVYWVNSMMPLALWAAAWVGGQALRRYRHGEIARLRADADRSALEFDALRARLNPHFVFNALNNLRALINEDTERARTMVTQLSNTLRHALDHSGAHEVSLREELAVVDDYLAIKQVHYEGRLRVERHIDAAALDATLPPMLLQLLVENAIKHGIARTVGGGALTITASRQAGTLRLIVQNPGQLNSGSGGHGVGLTYLRTRLAQKSASGQFALTQENDHVRACLEVTQ